METEITPLTPISQNDIFSESLKPEGQWNGCLVEIAHRTPIILADLIIKKVKILQNACKERIRFCFFFEVIK